MTAGRGQDDTMRLDRLAYRRLAWALVLSLALHLLCYGTYQAGKKLNWWEALHLPEWLQELTHLKPPPPPPVTPNEAPLVYVDVNPQQATKEAPKNTPYYSSRNSQAANPDADKDTQIPKIDGTQTQMTKTEDTARSPLDRLQPDFSKLTRNQEPEAARPSTAQPPGDLAMAKPDAELRQDQGTSDQPRPRTIREALLRQHRNQLVGEKMKQDGGVRLRLENSSMDAKATPFGQYDAEFCDAVQSRWFDLLDNVSYDGYRRGKVVVKFHLDYEGRISDMSVVDNNVGDLLGLLCQKAVLDPAPYAKWPADMRRMADKDYREIRFTFYYN
jgi:hypothetical protein